MVTKNFNAWTCVNGAWWNLKNTEGTAIRFNDYTRGAAGWNYSHKIIVGSGNTKPTKNDINLENKINDLNKEKSLIESLSNNIKEIPPIKVANLPIILFNVLPSFNPK